MVERTYSIGNTLDDKVGQPVKRVAELDNEYEASRKLAYAGFGASAATQSGLLLGLSTLVYAGSKALEEVGQDVLEE